MAPVRVNLAERESQPPEPRRPMRSGVMPSARRAWWKPGSYELIEAHLQLAKKGTHAAAVVFSRTLACAVERRGETEGEYWLPCPSPVDDPGSTYRVVAHYGTPALERQE